MKVSDLVKRLSEMPQDAEVVTGDWYYDSLEGFIAMSETQAFNYDEYKIPIDPRYAHHFTSEPRTRRNTPVFYLYDNILYVESSLGVPINLDLTPTYPYKTVGVGK